MQYYFKNLWYDTKVTYPIIPMSDRNFLEIRKKEIMKNDEKIISSYVNSCYGS